MVEREMEGHHGASCQQVGAQQPLEAHTGVQDRQNFGVKSESRGEKHDGDKYIQGQQQAAHVQHKSDIVVDHDLLEGAGFFDKTLHLIAEIDRHGNERENQHSEKKGR
jgi:hypothetical protein